MAPVPPTIRPAAVSEVRPLRWLVLRAGQPPETTVLPGDDDPLTRHVAALVDDEVVAVGSVMADPPPWEAERAHAWRVRGMATRDGARGGGLGGLVLTELIAYATGAGGTLLWCRARVRARSFYERFGMVTRGERFVSEGVEHVHMWRELGAARR